MSDWLEEAPKPPHSRLTLTMCSKVNVGPEGLPASLYFYPAHDTPGCTKEACAFRDRQAELQELGARLSASARTTSRAI